MSTLVNLLFIGPSSSFYETVAKIREAIGGPLGELSMRLVFFVKFLVNFRSARQPGWRFDGALHEETDHDGGCDHIWWHIRSA